MSTWDPVNVVAILAGGLTRPVPTMLERDDGAALLYPRKVHAFNADSETGKTWLALTACEERLRLGEAVLYIDFEADAPDILERLLSLGVTEAEAGARFLYVRPDEPFDERARQRVLFNVDAFGPKLVVLDGVAEAMAQNGWDENKNTDVIRFLTALPRLLEREGCTVVLIDHLRKDRETQGRYARGGGAKLAGITAAFKLEMLKPFGRGMTGLAKVTVTKDRPGSLRPLVTSGRLAEMEVASSPEGDEVVVTLRTPMPDEDFRPTFLMERVSRMLELSPDALTGNEVTRSVQDKREAVLAALKCLVDEGYVVRETGPRRAQLHRSVCPFREVDDR